MDGEHEILRNVVDQYDVDSAIRTENLALKSGGGRRRRRSWMQRMILTIFPM